MTSEPTVSFNACLRQRQQAIEFKAERIFAAPISSCRVSTILCAAECIQAEPLQQRQQQACRLERKAFLPHADTLHKAQRLLHCCSKNEESKKYSTRSLYARTTMAPRKRLKQLKTLQTYIYLTNRYGAPTRSSICFSTAHSGSNIGAWC